MLHCVVTALIFCVFAVTNASENNIPEPEIEVFQPRGFRISVEHNSDIKFVLFYVKVENESGSEIKNLSKYIRRKQDSTWTFIKRNFPLKVGYKLKYSAVIGRNGLEILSKEGECRIEEIGTSRPRQLGSKICRAFDKPLPLPAPEPPEPELDADYYLDMCEQTVLNFTQTLLTLQFRVMKLGTTNQQLLTLLQKYPDAKKLTVNGRIPPGGDPSATVTFLLREKLELNPGVVSAVRNSDKSITFEVENLTDKVDILEGAQEKLNDSQIVFS